MHAKVKQSAEPLVLCDKKAGVATLTLNRPKQYNAMSSDVLRELNAALARLAEDSAVRVVVIAARGPVFCSGHDLKEIKALLELRVTPKRSCSDVRQLAGG